MSQVLSKNIFEILEASEPKSAQSTTAVQQKPTTASTEKQTGGHAEKKTQQQSVSSRGTDYPKRGGFSGAKVIRPEDLVDQTKDRRPASKGHHHKGVKNGRGREFERRSGTGRVDGEKKDVAGKGAWGDALQAETVDAEGNPIVPKEVTEEAMAIDEEQKRQEEEEAKLMTLDQYLANKKPVGFGLNTNAGPRKANEGADNAQWKNAVVLKKDEEDYLKLGASKADENEKKNKAATEAAKQKQILAIEQRFADAERPNKRDNFSRGNARTGTRNGKSATSRPVNYDRDFPALKA